MLTAVVTRGLAVDVKFVAADEGDEHGAELMSYEESKDFCEFPYETEAEFDAEASAELSEATGEDEPAAHPLD